MIYYHGSRSNFKEFSIKGNGKHGEACHFAKSLYGNGTDEMPTVYTVKLTIRNPLNTMSVEHCQQVMESIGQKFKANKNAGGAKEQYYYLCKQLKSWGIADPNDAIQKAGFDAVYWDFCGHMIVFDSSVIEIQEINLLD